MFKRGSWRRLALRRTHSLIHTVKQGRFATYFWVKRGFAKAVGKLFHEGDFAAQYLAGVEKLGFIEKLRDVNVFLSTKQLGEGGAAERVQKGSSWVTFGKVDKSKVLGGIYDVLLYFPVGESISSGTISTALVHEVAHLWHFKLGQILALEKKSEKIFTRLRIKQASSPMMDENEVFGFKELYILLLDSFDYHKQVLYYEGLAEFCSFLQSDKYSFDGVRKEAESRVVSSKKLYDESLAVLETVIAKFAPVGGISSFNLVGRSDNAAEISAKIKSLDDSFFVNSKANLLIVVGEKSKEKLARREFKSAGVEFVDLPSSNPVLRSIISSWQLAQEARLKIERENILDYRLQLYSRSKSSVDHLAYKVGPAIIATLYHDGGYTLEDLSVMKPNKILKEYERVARRKGYTVLVSLHRSGKGIINYGALTARLNELRKQVDLRFH